uniref:MutS homolog 2, colon cancer, nonpolyposis type 1 (E. coli) [Taeniopygia guttata] n=2 Tax=Lepeophtheirus salmonis TaxID=72036 RepID=A0A0K2T3F1_LEPSM
MVDVLDTRVESLVSLLVETLDSDEIHCGLSYMSEIGKTLRFLDFKDTIHLDYIKVALSQLHPDKVIVTCEHTKTRNAVLKVLGIRGIKSVEIPIPSDDYDKDEITKRIKTLSNVYPFKVDLKKTPLAFHSFKYLDANMCDDDEIPEQYEVSFHPLEEYMTLGERAIQSLDLFSDIPANLSLYKLLNKCRTRGGERLLKDWIRQPLKNEESIRVRLDIVELFVDNTDLRDTLHNETLRKIPDFENLSVRLAKKNCKLPQLFNIFTGVYETKKIIEQLEPLSEKCLKTNFLSTLKSNVDKMKGYQAMINKSLDFEAIKDGEFFIRPTFDEGMVELRNQMKDLRGEMESENETVISDLEMDSTKHMRLEYSDTHGYHFRVTLKYELSLRDHEDNYNIIEAAKNGIKFQTKALTRMSEDYEAMKAQYNVLQERILEEILDIAFGYSKFIFRIGQSISKLDVLVSFAVAALASPIPYIKPTIREPSSHRIIKMMGVRHPILEIAACMSSYIPNDIHFDSMVNRFHILTGPNLGGKSTYMRSIAVSLVMAQIGCFVPCDEAEFSIVDKILVRVGAEDRQFEGVSTFMAEMLDVANILRNATTQSLAIIDEIGRGTSTYDGIGVAYAVADKIIREMNIFTIFATHFFELTELGDIHESVRNYHVSADTESGVFTLLYKVLEGKCNKSFGIEVAKLCKLPDKVIEESEEILEKYERNSSIGKMLNFDDDQLIELENILESLPSGSEERKKCLKNVKENFFSEEKWKKLMDTIKSNQ